MVKKIKDLLLKYLIDEKDRHHYWMMFREHEYILTDDFIIIPYYLITRDNEVYFIASKPQFLFEHFERVKFLKTDKKTWFDISTQKLRQDLSFKRVANIFFMKELLK